MKILYENKNKTKTELTQSAWRDTVTADSIPSDRHSMGYDSLEY